MKRFLISLILILNFCFRAFSAQRPLINSLRFEGNSHFSDKKLSGLIGTKACGLFRRNFLYEDILIQDIKTVVDFYYKSGFFDMRIKDVEIVWLADSSKVDIRLFVEEKEPVIIDSVLFLGNEKVSEKALRKLAVIRPGRRVNFDEINLTEQRIVEYYGNRGFLSASVSREIVREQTSATLFFTITEGPKYYLGDIEVSGNKKTPDWLLKKGCDTKTNETLTLTSIENYREKLFLQGIYSSIDITPLPTDKDSVRNLLVIIKEREPGELSFGGGFDNEEGPRLIAQFNYLNLFHRAAGVRVDSRMSFYERLIEAQFHEPYFLRSDFYFKSSLTLNYKVEPDFDRQSWSFKSSWGIFPLKQWQIECGYDLHQTVLINVQEDLLEEESGFLIQNVQVSQLFVESIYDTRDSKILTRKGHLFRTKASVSHFLMKRQPGFLRLEGGIRKFIPIKRFGVLAFQMKSGSIFNASEDPVPLEERFFFSGNTNVRGYPKNFIGPKTTAGTPYGGEYFYLLRSELRIHIWHALWSKFFFDNGGIYRNITTSSWEGSANGLGTGIRILYGIWSARLEYAWKLEGNKFQPGRWYFELGQEF